MDYLTYSPDIKIMIDTQDHGTLDVSDDVVRASVKRRVDARSNMTFTLQNRGWKYAKPDPKQRVFRPNDRIICYMKRIKWVQVFAGYLDTVPMSAISQSTVSFSASCTLKLLEYSYVDTGLPALQAILAQNETLAAKDADAGFGHILYDLLFRVGQWDPNQIFISGIPEGFLSRAIDLSEKLVTKFQSEEVRDEINRLLSIESVTGPSGVGGGSSIANTSGIPADLLPIIKEEAGVAGLPAALVAAVIKNESGFKPTAIGSNPSSKDYGLMQLNDKTWRGTFPDFFPPSNKWQDPRTNIKAGCHVLKGAYSAEKGDVYNALRRYNGGPSWAKKSATKTYADRVYKYYQEFSGGSVTTTSLETVSTGATTVSVPDFSGGATTEQLKSWFGASESEVYKNLVDVTFRGKVVKFHKLAAPALQAVEAGLARYEANGGTYRVRTHDGTFNWRTATGSTKLSRHAFGIAIDVNRAQNPYTHRMTNYTDMPSDWVQIWKDAGFGWGGDWKSVKDAMHFQWEGGAVGEISVGGGTGGPLTVNDAYKIGRIAAFHTAWMGNESNAMTDIMKGQRRFINDTKLLSLVRQACSASMRSFCSSPGGDFLAWFPDYFGACGRTPYFEIRDIEIRDTDGTIYENDGNLVTHLYVAGDTVGHSASGPGGDGINFTDWLATAGAVTVEQEGLLELFVDTVGNSDLTPTAILNRYGPRPKSMEFGLIQDPKFEVMTAFQQFMLHWAQRFSAPFSFTFMPELFPGTRVRLSDRGLAFYVQEVSHDFDWENGGVTNATLIAPTTTTTGTGSGLPWSQAEIPVYDWASITPIVDDAERELE